MVQLQDSHILFVAGHKIAAVTLLPELYTRRNYTPAWQDPGKREELIEIISHIEAEGLKPEDYLLSTLQDFQARDDLLSDTERVDYDLLLTESLVRLGYHLRFGKVDPRGLNSSWNLERSVGQEDPATVIQSAIDSASLRAFIDRVIPRQPFYSRYQQALAEYRRIRDAGGWPAVPSGPTLKPGMHDARITLLKQRLQHEGLLPETTVMDDHYDRLLEQAVIVFQQRHGLARDGAVGKKTLAALNVTVGERIDQIRVNLERGRWLFKDVRGDFLVVNIAGFKAYLVRDNRLIWTSRVVIGRPYRKTPEFKSQIKYLVLNPSWTVPPGILRKDVLPRARQDPAYIRAQRFEVVDRSGQRVNPGSVDWAAYSGKNFPYTLVQPPGDDNALGRIKFTFPNPHLVYLHDTPHKELFEQPVRTFSSGCIRIENPLELATYLLEEDARWSREKIAAAIATGKTQIVNLPRGLPIMLLYWTVVIEEDGAVHFRKDIYGRDQKILQALNGEFNISLPEGLPDYYYH